MGVSHIASSARERRDSFDTMKPEESFVGERLSLSI